MFGIPPNHRRVSDDRRTTIFVMKIGEAGGDGEGIDERVGMEMGKRKGVGGVRVERGGMGEREKKEREKRGVEWEREGQEFTTNLSLDSSDYLKDDSVTFCCMVRVVQSCIRPNNFTIIPPPPEMEKDFKYLLDSEIGSDIVFLVKDVTFKAHKVILAARSPVFKAQFYGLVGKPALDKVELMDMEPTVFKAMLLFIYSDKLPDSQESTGSMSHMIQHLLVAADRFGLDRLKRLCEANLCEELNVDAVATTLSFAHDHHCSELKNFCMDFAVANLRAVIQTEGYKCVEKSCPLLLLELLPKIAELPQKVAS
ncbi:BTB/POZ/MATH-domains containing protein [Tanacetum coccineum]